MISNNDIPFLNDFQRELRDATPAISRADLEGDCRTVHAVIDRLAHAGPRHCGMRENEHTLLLDRLRKVSRDLGAIIERADRRAAAERIEQEC